MALKINLLLLFISLLCNTVLVGGDDVQRSKVLSLVDMHASCEGLCFYFNEKGWDETGDCAKNGDSKCELIVRIVGFTPTCNPGTIPYLSKLLCNETGKGNHLYEVTIGRKVKNNDCDQAGQSAYCVSRSFVGLAFTTKVADLKTEDNPYYICVGDEPGVQSWLQGPEGKGQRVRAQPFPSQGVSTLWSKIEEPDKQNSILCTFFISDALYSYTSNTTVEPIAIVEGSFKFGSFGGGPTGWDLKVARGLAVRNHDTLVLEEVNFSPTENCPVPTQEDKKKVICDQSVIWPAKGQITADRILAQTPTLPPLIPFDMEQNFDNLEAMSNVYQDCMEKKRLCYTLDHERGCLHREMCHILLAIQATDSTFDVLHIDILSHTLDTPGILKSVRPSGWASIAFSVDQHMGDDFVLTCSYYGVLTNVYSTLNLRGSNIYYADAPYQSLLENKAYRVGKKDSELEPRVMCSFDLIQTEDFLISKRPYEREDINFNFKSTDYYILMAYGHTVSRRWNISYHSHKEVVRRKFSQKIYDGEVNNGSPIHLTPMYFLSTLNILLLNL